MALIRAATERDASSIARVHVQSWRATYKGIVPDAFLARLDEQARAAQWRNRLKTPAHVFVAEINGAVVGFVAGGALREPVETYDAELCAIYLLRESQRSGIGSALLAALAGSLAAGGFRGMVAWVLEGNAATRFYAKTGAHPIATKPMEIGGAPLSAVAYGWPSLTLDRPVRFCIEPRSRWSRCGRNSLAGGGCPLCAGHLRAAASSRRAEIVFSSCRMCAHAAGPGQLPAGERPGPGGVAVRTATGR